MTPDEGALMSKMSKLGLPGVAAAAALVAAACGSGGGYGAGAQPTAPSGDRPSPVTSIAVAGSRLGPVVVDGAGRTLYVFERDIPDTSTCYDSCAAAWPPLLSTGAPVAGSNVDPAAVGTAMRSNGSAQVTYHGRPLYLFTGDRQPGDTTGQALDAFGARWYAVDADGAEVLKL